MRFALYGRVSTEDAQDPASCRAWQLRRAVEVIGPAGGELVAEYFDIGRSRSLPWKRRPKRPGCSLISPTRTGAGRPW
jgi:DNA invertase Pin-like site-specific DNA recombinase